MSQALLLQVWSWLLTITNVVGLYLVGRKHIAGWVVGVTAQLFLLTYALVTQQSGFVAAALIYGTMHARNWYRWHNEAQTHRVHRPAKCAGRGACHDRGRTVDSQTPNP